MRRGFLAFQGKKYVLVVPNEDFLTKKRMKKNDTVTDSNDCKAHNMVWVRAPGLGLKNLSSLPGFILFPNPANKLLHVRFNSKDPGLAQVSIWSLEGRRLMQRQIWAGTGPQEIKLAIEGLAAGHYLLRLDLPDISGYLRWKKY